MILSDIVTRVADDSGSLSTITAVNNRIIREINRVCFEVWNSYSWSWRYRQHRIVTNVEVTDTSSGSGTLTATNGSRTVTSSGTPFTSSHVGWFIRFSQDSIQNWYRIRFFTSSSQIELDVPYTGTTGSSKTFNLRQLDYVLPTEIMDLGSIVVTYSNKPIPVFTSQAVDIVEPTPLSFGFPFAVSIYESDSKPTTYTTGTVSGTINTLTLTGSGTSWLANVYPGDSVAIGTNTYTAFNVDTDTQITLYNNQQATTSASAYTITRQFGRILRIIWSSNDKYTLAIRGLRAYPPLINNNDTNELCYRFPDYVVDSVVVKELRQKADRRSEDLYLKSRIQWQSAKAQDEALTPKYNPFQIHTYRQGVRERIR